MFTDNWGPIARYREGGIIVIPKPSPRNIGDGGVSRLRNDRKCHGKGAKYEEKQGVQD